MKADLGKLYIVATPIGNLADISQRALDTLTQVNYIAAEDTRHSQALLNHYRISTRLLSLHDFNEAKISARILALLSTGHDVALISDAGTPMISDPGFVLVRDARQAGIQVIPIPGSSAVIAALSVAGLPTDHFVFEGFLPAKAVARQKRLTELTREPRTIVFYESTHRLLDCLADCAEIFGKERQVVLAKELTKQFEAVISGNFVDLREWLLADAARQKGEFVVLVHGRESVPIEESAIETLKILLAELPLKQAVELTGKITGMAKNKLYQLALELKKRD